MSFGSRSHTSESSLANGTVGRGGDILETNLLRTPGPWLFWKEPIYSVSWTSNSSKFYLPCHPEPLDTCKHLPVMDQLDGWEYQKGMGVEIRRLYLCREAVARYRRVIEQVRYFRMKFR
ncbi:hypothetical protein TNIN_244981 [Trichonephila inaurata madagascariensis]|uniref:Uncharacterized protein n=1 Tax=Trichonephila inaurata madagascariensis TaxID=2747483 RepID=A0A8X7CB84_9ARAC|nr:hypothetical protein TNIN_244981 [Trichonephila inaurata madagascariensis]